jgi:hypothetical protein
VNPTFLLGAPSYVTASFSEFVQPPQSFRPMKTPERQQGPLTVRFFTTEAKTMAVSGFAAHVILVDVIFPTAGPAFQFQLAGCWNSFLFPPAAKFLILRLCQI